MFRAESSFSQLQLAVFAKKRAGKLRFHNCNLQFLQDVLHESFVLTTSSFTLNFGRGLERERFLDIWYSGCVIFFCRTKICACSFSSISFFRGTNYINDQETLDINE